jgi:glycosyltransferase involved in cell wall biosynthesis
MNPTRLFVDVTGLTRWRGKLTGIQRVIDELSMRFHEDGSAIFVVWDGARRSFRRIDYAAISADASTHSVGLMGIARRAKARSRLLARTVTLSKRIARTVFGWNLGTAGTELVRPDTGDVVLLCANLKSDQIFIDHVIELQADGVLVAQIAYDLLPILYPQYCGHSTERLTSYVQNVYPICDTILAISEHTKRDIASWLSLCGLPVPRIDVFRLGDDFTLEAALQQPTDESFRNAYNRDTRYLVCVGTFEVRKNHALLYYTYKLAHEKNIELPPIVIVGRRAWLSDDLYEVMTHDPQTKAKFIFLHDATDEELAWLYQHCQFSVYPSFYEGWGLPIGESLAYGVPCLASKTSSMPEVGGDLVTYFSPASTDECLRAITTMLQPGCIDEAKRRLNQYEPARWDDTFQSVRSRLRELQHGGRPREMDTS